MFNGMPFNVSKTYSDEAGTSRITMEIFPFLESVEIPIDKRKYSRASIFDVEFNHSDETPSALVSLTYDGLVSIVEEEDGFKPGERIVLTQVGNRPSILYVYNIDSKRPCLAVISVYPLSIDSIADRLESAGRMIGLAADVEDEAMPIEKLKRLSVEEGRIQDTIVTPKKDETPDGGKGKGKKGKKAKGKVPHQKAEHPYGCSVCDGSGFMADHERCEACTLHEEKAQDEKSASVVGKVTPSLDHNAEARIIEFEAYVEENDVKQEVKDAKGGYVFDLRLRGPPLSALVKSLKNGTHEQKPVSRDGDRIKYAGTGVGVALARANLGGLGIAHCLRNNGYPKSHKSAPKDKPLTQVDDAVVSTPKEAAEVMAKPKGKPKPSREFTINESLKHANFPSDSIVKKMGVETSPNGKSMVVHIVATKNEMIVGKAMAIPIVEPGSSEVIVAYAKDEDTLRKLTAFSVDGPEANKVVDSALTAVLSPL